MSTSLFQYFITYLFVYQRMKHLLYRYEFLTYVQKIFAYHRFHAYDQIKLKMLSEAAFCIPVRNTMSQDMWCSLLSIFEETTQKEVNINIKRLKGLPFRTKQKISIWVMVMGNFQKCFTSYHEVQGRFWDFHQGQSNTEVICLKFSRNCCLWHCSEYSNYYILSRYFSWI